MHKFLIGLSSFVVGAAMMAGVQTAEAHWPTKGQDIAVAQCLLHPELYFRSHCDDHWHAFAEKAPWPHQ